jgi:tRNA-splicing ligase RtcB
LTVTQTPPAETAWHQTEAGYRIHIRDGVPIKSWASSVEEGAVQQALNLARLPFVISHVALMPDAHQGYGMPIGGVLFTDAVVVPYAIGVDIGCGVNLFQTDLEVGELGDGVLEKVLAQILREIPVGNGPHGNHKTQQASENDIAGDAGTVQWGWAAKASFQLGSLGGGNHFIELQADEDDRVYLMLHSGSRSLGKNICDHYHKLALTLNRTWFSELPDKELAYLPWATSEAANYWAAMQLAMKFAEDNRANMAEKAIYSIQRHVGRSLTVEPVADCHHNYAAWENHGGKNGIVHRKGAVRARQDDDVLIPGSMGTSSYWAIGLGNPDSFNTSPHGAGRAMSRGVARKAHGVAEMDAMLTEAGTVLLTSNREEVLDEGPWAYKDVDQVMRDSETLVEINRQLRPLGTVKG